MTAVPTIVPAYNACDSVGDALRNALAQTHQEWIVFVGEEDSVDGTPAGAGAERSADVASLLVACWHAAIEAGRGRSAAHLLAESRHMADAAQQVDALVDTLVGGLTIGAQVPANRLLGHWPMFWPMLQPVIDAIASPSRCPGLARQITSGLENALLARDTVRAPQVLATVMLASLDLAHPQDLTAPHPGIDEVLLQVHCGQHRPSELRLPFWGGVLPFGTVAACIMDRFGSDRLVRGGRFRRRPAYWLALLRQLARRDLAQSPLERRGALARLNALRQRWRQAPRAVLSEWVRVRRSGEIAADTVQGILQSARGTATGDVHPLPDHVATPMAIPVRVDNQPFGTVHVPRDWGLSRHAVIDAGARHGPYSAWRETPADFVPVLRYGQVIGRAAPEDPAHLSARGFEQHLEWLSAHGFHSVTSQDLASRGETPPMSGCPVLLAFEDPGREFLAHAWPLLRRYGFVAELFLSTAYIADASREGGVTASEGRLTWQDLRLLRDEGARFGSRLHEPRSVQGLGNESLLSQAALSRAALERGLRQPVRSMALPAGAADDRVCHVLEAAGYLLALDNREGIAATTGDPLRLPSFHVTQAWSAAHLDCILGALFPQDLVGVIIPAFNAASTIERTLNSVLAQTHRHLDIVVVDDGSTDDTVRIVQRYATSDSRIRLIEQTNQGVAAARNRAAAEIRGEFIAPIDADDLWHPHKIARQLRAMAVGGPKVGLTYCGHIVIDEQDKTTALRPARLEGAVAVHLASGNIIGNGSTPLMRAQLVRRFGYDATLRARDAQGCEDYKLYFQIACEADYALVRDELVGYRRVPGNMSSSTLKMLRSFDLVASEFRGHLPELAHEFHMGRNFIMGWLLSIGLDDGNYRASAALLRQMFSHDRGYALAAVWREVWYRLLGRLSIVIRAFERMAGQR